MCLHYEGGFLHYFTEDWAGSDRFTGTGTLQRSYLNDMTYFQNL